MNAGFSMSQILKIYYLEALLPNAINLCNCLKPCRWVSESMKCTLCFSLKIIIDLTLFKLGLCNNANGCGQT